MGSTKGTALLKNNSLFLESGVENDLAMVANREVLFLSTDEELDYLCDYIN